jgi:hypothetical protein
MTVMVREDVNAADLAWAAADPSLTHLAKEMQQVRAVSAADALSTRRAKATGTGALLPESTTTGSGR